MQLGYEDYTIAWIAALPHELAPAIALLDERHEPLEGIPGDKNTYTLGRVGQHNVVITGLPKGKIGTNITAGAVSDLIRSFKNVRCGLMVGIGGGAPSSDGDVRLGDVVVGSAGVLQYDFGTRVQVDSNGGSDDADFICKAKLYEPSSTLQSVLSSIEANAMVEGYELNAIYEGMLTKKPAMRRSFQRPTIDILYNANYLHTGGANCSECDVTNSITRSPRDEVAVHYGKIGCGNQVIRNALFRDKLRLKEGILCFEMEAAGFPPDFDYLVVRGICDYCDSHKNKDWQPYAAAIAAAYAKEILLSLPAQQVESMPKSKILQSINDGLDKIGNDTTKLINRQHDYGVRQAIAWLHAPEPETNLRAALERREPGTGSWLLNSEAFVGWKLGSKQHIWLLGKAGCGKTVLASTAIEDMRAHCIRNGIGFAMFYFTFSDTSKQTWSDCFRSLTAQLVTTETAVTKLLDLHEKNSTRPCNDEMLQDIFTVISASHDSIYVILDALDESPQDSGTDSARALLLDALNILTRVYPNVHFFVTSRELPDIRDKLIEMGCEQIHTTPDKIDEDIRIYVMEQLNSNARLSKFSRDLKHQVERELMLKADGMFRWVYCQIEHLSNLKLMRRSEIEKALASLPKTLDETYERMLNSINDELRDDMVTLLRWLAYAKRPLTLRELSEVIIIDIKDKSNAVHTDDRPYAEGILDLLSSLVKKTHLFFDSRKMDPDEVYELAHFSVKEYLESSRSRLLYFHLEAELDNHLLSLSSIAYLSYYCEQLDVLRSELAIDLANPWIYDSEIPEEVIALVESLPMLDYVPFYWFAHHIPALGCDDAVRFLTSMKNLDGWWIINCILWSIRADFDKRIFEEGARTGLQYALYFRLEDVFKALLDVVADPDERNQVGETALYMACAAARYIPHYDKFSPESWDRYCEMLIEAGANVNIRDNHGWMPLHAAAEANNISAMKMLLAAGAELNSEITGMTSSDEDVHETPLQLATGSRNFGCIDLLLEAGAELGDGRGRSAQNLLWITVEKSELVTLKILMERGVDVNSDPDRGVEALGQAIHDGNPLIIEIIMEHGFSSDADKFKGKMTPLLYAAMEGQTEILDMLARDYGWSVEHRGGPLQNAVQAALSSGSKETFACLIKHGADVLGQLRESCVALIQACEWYNSREKVIAIFDIIHEYCPSYRIPQDHLDIALLHACYGDDVEKCKFLVSCGADINSSLLQEVYKYESLPLADQRPVMKWLTESRAISLDLDVDAYLLWQDRSTKSVQASQSQDDSGLMTTSSLSMSLKRKRLSL